MKKLILILLVAVSFASCKKTTEAITLLGKWEVDSYSENGTDKTTIFKASYTNYLLTFDASNNYIETYTIAGVNVTNAGSWKMTNGGDDFEFTNQADNSKRFFHVIEINPASASISEDGGTKEYHLLKK
jgi:hypothetical protein